MTELVKTGTSSLSIGSFRLGPKGLTVKGDPSFADWRRAGKTLRQIDETARWWRGDWIVYGETRSEWGDKYEHECGELGLDYGSVANLKSLSKEFNFSRRREKLSWNHHAAVASLPEKEQDRLLDLAEREQLPYRELRKVVREVRHEAKRLTRAWPDGQYGLIYCDPPWQPFDGALDPTREIENQYPTMTVEELVVMAEESPLGEPGGVKSIAAPDCALVMWTTAQKLAESCEVIDAWGFTLKTGAVWVKDSIGMGHWFRQRHEILILATTGSPMTPPEGERQDSVIMAPRRGHSEKPEEAYSLLEGMFSGVPKVELFRRGEPRPGWDGWGNE